MFENTLVQATGLPETVLLSPKTHRCQSAERGELALRLTSGKARTRVICHGGALGSDYTESPRSSGFYSVQQKPTFDEYSEHN